MIFFQLFFYHARLLMMNGMAMLTVPKEITTGSLDHVRNALLADLVAIKSIPFERMVGEQ